MESTIFNKLALYKVNKKMLGYVAIVHIYSKTNINILIEMWWLIWGDVVAQLVARNTSRAEAQWNQAGTRPWQARGGGLQNIAVLSF